MYFCIVPHKIRGLMKHFIHFKNFTMKKVEVLKGFLAIALMAFCSINLNAKGTVSINSYLKTNYAVVSAHNSELSNFKVKVLDAEGNELYSSPYIKSTNAFQKLFDLNTFEDGIYSVMIVAKNEIIKKSFMVESSKLIITDTAKQSLPEEEAKESVNTKPFFRKEGNNIYLSHLNFKKHIFSISIDDVKGNEVFNSNLPIKTSYSGIFNISQLPVGEYSVLIKSGKETYHYEFNK